ncbi:unnamed protein product [Prunus armeniaca]|uniref:Uncharacterized protein n=1 Tax=Prunus armeniaca TaxID=36596 RepID=A0A6J5WMU8_PRUAR|nr:unnamed protein product [Prunus armeniaca]
MPPNLYQCTAGCAYNFITTTTPTQSNDDSASSSFCVFTWTYGIVADAEKLKKDIGSCYKKCQKYSQGLLG